MAVTISIEGQFDAQHVLFEDDDPLYWFLYPYFEETYHNVGQMVDLYDNAQFFAEELLALFLVLENAECDIRSGNDKWDVTLGYNGKDRTPITKHLHKSDALARIQAFKEMLNHAYNVDRRVVCFSD